MKLFIFRHSKRFSSWSMLDEPHIARENYTMAEVTVLAETLAEAHALLAADEKWDMAEIKRISPEVVTLDRPKVVSRTVL